MDVELFLRLTVVGKKDGDHGNKCSPVQSRPVWALKITYSLSAAHVERVPASELKEIATREEAKIWLQG